MATIITMRAFISSLLCLWSGLVSIFRLSRI